MMIEKQLEVIINYSSVGGSMSSFKKSRSDQQILGFDFLTTKRGDDKTTGNLHDAYMTHKTFKMFNS